MGELKARPPRRPQAAPPMELSGGGSELASRISAAADEPAATDAPAAGERRALDGLSFARLCPATAGAISETEQALRERTWAAAVRVAARAVTELLTALPVEDTRSSARAALLGLDGREYLRLGRLAQKPDAGVTEQDALFALYLLVAASVKAERI
jgi:hypothetical protein